MFKPGDLVLCIDNKPGNYNPAEALQLRVYKVRACGNNTLWITEIKSGFSMSRFIKTTKVSARFYGKAT